MLYIKIQELRLQNGYPGSMIMRGILLYERSPPKSARSIVLTLHKSRLYFTDGGKSEQKLMEASGEPLRPLSKFILNERPGVKELNGSEIWSITNERNQYRAAYNNKWNATATELDSYGMPTGTVDVILCPAGPGAAPPLDCARYWAYTSQWNLLDYSALTFPVGNAEYLSRTEC